MSTQYSLFKSRLHNLLVLASLILCLGADSCSQCRNANTSNEEPPTKKVAVQIVPLSSLALVGGNKTIKCKLQQANDSVAVDLAKLQLKITVVSIPVGEDSKISYQGMPVNELAGEQVGLGQPFELIINTKDTTEEVVVTLQIVYENSEVGDPQVFVWKKNVTADKEVAAQIVPLSSQSLVGDNKLIQCKLQQANNSAAVDLAKLQLKITTVSTPAGEANQILYQNNPISELSGNQVGLDQAFELTIDTTGATEKVDITLQIIYEDKPLADSVSARTFTWKKIDATGKLFQAIHNNNKEEAIALLNQGNIRADARDLSGHPLLNAAIAYNNDPAVIEKLLSVPGIDLNTASGWPEYLPLESAIAENQLEAFKLLLAKGAKTKPGTTILHVAIEKPMIPMIKYILDNYEHLKDSKDKDGNTPLHLAVTNTFPKLVNLLLNKGADRSIKNNAGKTPEGLIQNTDAPGPSDSNFVKQAFNGSYTATL